ncbi:unnamed protein product [Mytilus coruscus]|uniref:BEN domain-containing protein n=1 Tax=Mytilus coruscus TaxID=42192 RepID=A0A6J8ELI7_MYTCO|nr:unnamed protein product [Mytilus coruscus]
MGGPLCLFILLYFRFCESFLLERTTATPSNGLSEKHYTTLLQQYSQVLNILVEERQLRQSHEESVTQMHTEFTSKMNHLILNETEILKIELTKVENKYFNMKQDFDIFKKDYTTVQRELALSKNTNENEIRALNSKQQTRNQDLIALYNRIHGEENNLQDEYLQRSKVLKTRPAFSSDNDLTEILKQVEINNARSSLLERLLLKQQETIEKLFAFVTRHLQPQESENTQRISTARRSLIDAVENESDVPSPLPSHSSRLPDIPLTPTTSHITTLEQRNTFSPTFGFNMSTPPMRQSLTVPYSLFSDIPEQFLISENDLSRAIHSSKGPGNFACHIMPILFPELFTSDNLRTMYTFYGGGKLNKNPLNRQKREFLRRYVVTVFPEVMCDKAFNERVLSKVNQLLRRPVHRK